MTQDKDFDLILEKTMCGGFPSHAEIEVLLKATGASRERLSSAARQVRDKVFGGKVFLYGFVYFSTFCRNNCTFCFYRSANKAPRRYRKTLDEMLGISAALKKSGVHLIDLTMGEDPAYLSSEEGLSDLVHAVNAVKAETGLPVMVSPGVLPAGTIAAMAEIGAEWYACYQETYSTSLFRKLRIRQCYDTRMHAKSAAIDRGMLVEDGILVGVGEALPDVAGSIRGMGELGAAQVRVMTYVPQDGAPLAGSGGGNFDLELNTIAVMRLLYPQKFIPASLDVEGKKGLRQRLDSGANVVTSIIPPETGLAGVSNPTLDITNGERSVEGILDTIELCNLSIAGQDEYNAALCALRQGAAEHKTRGYWGKASGS